MIYMDVTSSCKSPRPTGVQRVVRGIFREWRRREKIIPLIWQESLNSYCRLSWGQQLHLRGLSLFPLEQNLLRGASQRWQFTMNRLRPISLETKLSPGDFFIQAEIFQDSRIEWMERSLARVEGVKKVAVFHDALNWSHPHLSATGRLTRFEDYMKQLAGCDYVFAVSEFSAAALRQFWRESMSQGPDVRAIHPVLGWKKRPRLAPIRERQRNIPYVATLEPRKNHLALLDACQLLWDKGHRFRLVLVGREGPGQGKQIAAKIRKWIREGKPVEWHAGLGESAIKRLYKKARFTLYPSLVEGFGLPVLESLWFGAPCLCHQEGAVKETSSGGGCHCVDVKRVETLAQGIEDLLDDKQRILRLYREAKERKFRTWVDYVDDVQKNL